MGPAHNHITLITLIGTTGKAIREPAKTYWYSITRGLNFAISIGNYEKGIFLTGISTRDI